VEPGFAPEITRADAAELARLYQIRWQADAIPLRVDVINGHSSAPARMAAQDPAGFLNLLQERIKHQWDPGPFRDQRVVVTLTVAPNGQLLASRVKESSNNALADQAALRAIQQAAPFSPLPPTLGQQPMTLDFHFNN
jgi:TonB family protein